jgi:hypothetical protein
MAKEGGWEGEHLTGPHIHVRTGKLWKAPLTRQGMKITTLITYKLRESVVIRVPDIREREVAQGSSDG